MSIAISKTDEIRDWFRQDKSRMTMVASRKFEVPEGEVIRALVGEWPITELKVESFREIMDALKAVGLVRIFVRSRAAVIEVDGRLSEANYSLSGPFFNVDGGGIDMHIMHKDIASIYAVEKRSHMDAEDVTYSLQFYDNQGDAVFKMFVWENFPKFPKEVVDTYNALVEKFKS
jgi:putative hemin transport protein